MNPDVLKYLQDVIDSIDRIEFHIKDISNSGEYAADLTKTDAVERRLGIIGEALWQINKIESSITVTDQKRIIGLRHILIHDYDLVDDATIWKICQTSLPTLKKEIKDLIEKRDG